MARRKRRAINPALLILLLIIAAAVFLLDYFGIINVFGGFGERGTVPEGTLEVHFIDVGQGDSALIKTTEGHILIDCSTKESKDTVLNYLEAQGVDKLKYIIFTHPHEDHMGCAAEILSAVEVENVVMPNATNSAQYFERAIDVIEEKSLNVIEAKSGLELTLGGMKMTFLSPIEEKYSNLNNYSSITMLDFGNISFMFTGDAEELVEKEVLQKYGSDLHCDVLKVGHHGSTTSTSEEFLKAVSPKYAVISVGEGNSYNHPEEEILLRLEKYNVTYYMTKDEGTVVFTTDGTSLRRE